MMRGLVDPQRTALRAQPVPAPEIVGAVAGVEVPREVHRRHLADGARHQQFLDPLMLRRVAVIEGHDDVAAALAFGIQHGLALLLVDRHRLFGHDVEPALEAAHDVFAVVAVDGRDHQQVRLGFRQHLVEVREGRAGDAHLLLRDFSAQRVDVAQPDELDDVAVLLRDRAAPHPDRAHAGADNGVAPFRLGGQRWRS